MRFAIILAAVLVTLAPTSGSVQGDANAGMIAFGNQFYNRCVAAESPRNGVDDTTLFFCLGYMEGLTHGVMAAEIPQTSKTFCLPSPEVTNQQLVRIVRKYIADHPEKTHEVTAILAVEALRKAFPCGN
jgi:hypothetical protein